VSDETFTLLGVRLSSQRVIDLLERLGYSKLVLEWGRGYSGFDELRLCCDSPSGRRMFATVALEEVSTRLIDALVALAEKAGPPPSGSALAEGHGGALVGTPTVVTRILQQPEDCGLAEGRVLDHWTRLPSCAAMEAVACLAPAPRRDFGAIGETSC
jgi:hypothetical protein